MSGGQPTQASRYHRRALRMLGWPLRGAPPARPDPPTAALAATLLISLAHAEAEQGRTALGVSLLDRAELLVDEADRGALNGQRGLFLLRTGKYTAALESLDTAVSQLTAHGNHREAARALLNRGVCLYEFGRVDAAARDLHRCGELARELGWESMEAKALQNLGCCRLVRGDVPAALATLARAAACYEACDPGNLPVLMVDKARVLIAVGLTREAGAELDTAVELFRRQRLSQDQGEAELLQAQVALASGEPAQALAWARRARETFQRRGNTAAAAQAELTELRALSAEGAAPGRIAAHAARLSAAFRTLSRPEQALTAQLIRIQALIAAGRGDDARQLAAALPRPRPHASLESRLVRHLTLAELDVDRAPGRPGPALRRLRGALNLLQEHRAVLGSLELQTGVSALGAQLADRGLALALAQGAPGLVLSWSERSRGQAQVLRSVLPPEDDEVAEELAELRRLDQALRAARESGAAADPRLAERHAALERRVRERSWQARGVGTPTRVATLPELMARLSEAGQTMVSFIDSGPALYALVLGDGEPRLVDLGGIRAQAAETARRLNADLDALAGRFLPPRMEASVVGSIRANTAWLDKALFAPLRLPDDDRDLVIVPTGELSAVAWNLVPALRGRPVTVAPSASRWLTACQAAARGPHGPDGGDPAPPLLLAGPGPRKAVAEIDAIGGHYPRHRRFTGSQATVEASLRALDGAEMAHLAAHGHHQARNALFSRLELADGPLMAYDVLRLHRPPRHVVLSACEVGRNDLRAGGELLGFATTLLRTGTPTVIAATTRIGDTDAIEAMTAYHGLLRHGLPPARALAAAAQKAQYAPLICLGAG
jgi:tetratricopeptide (TPR) repeat protein